MPRTAKASVQELISLMFVIGRFMRGETHQKKGKGASHSMLQFETVRYIKEHERAPMRDVAAYFSITPPAATLLIDGLAKEGLLARILDVKDRRTVRVALTQKGRAFLARGMQKKIGKLKRLFGALSSEERAALVVILKKMAKNTKQLP